MLMYERPAACFTEALPIGNGRLGGMVFGGATNERILLNEDTLWSGPPGDWNVPESRAVLPALRAAIREERYVEADALARRFQGRFTQSYLPLGELAISFAHGAVSEYARSLDLETAIAATRFVAGDAVFEREAFVSHPDQCLVVRLRASGSERFRFSARLSSALRHAVRSRDGAIVLTGRAPVHVEPDYRDVEPAVVDVDDAGLTFAACLCVVTDQGTVV
jgi:alpha-L-fucosidase 2